MGFFMTIGRTFEEFESPIFRHFSPFFHFFHFFSVIKSNCFLGFFGYSGLSPIWPFQFLLFHPFPLYPLPIWETCLIKLTHYSFGSWTIGISGPGYFSTVCVCVSGGICFFRLSMGEITSRTPIYVFMICQ